MIEAIRKKMKSEKDFYKRKYKGLTCIIRRAHGHLNGYVLVPGCTPLYGVAYDELSDVDVHGGLTFGDTVDKGFTQGEEGYALGFDTAHLGDLYLSGGPSEEELFVDLQRMDPSATYKDYEYVKAETEKLAEFILNYKKQ